MGSITVVAIFVLCLLQLVIYEGLRPAAVFVGLWLVGFLGATLFGVSAGAVFMVWQALLCIAIQFYIKARNPDT